MKKQKLSKLALWSLALPIIWIASFIAVFITEAIGLQIANQIAIGYLIIIWLMLPFVAIIIQIISLIKLKNKKDRTVTTIGLIITIIIIIAILLAMILYFEV